MLIAALCLPNKSEAQISKEMQCGPTEILMQGLKKYEMYPLAYDMDEKGFIQIIFSGKDRRIVVLDIGGKNNEVACINQEYAPDDVHYGEMPEVLKKYFDKSTKQ